MKITRKQKGFVLLFTAVLSAVVLTVALGTANIAYKEISFSTSAKDTNEAFFAADVGAECALFHDRAGSSAFPPLGGGSLTIDCNGSSIGVTEYGTGREVVTWDFFIENLGNEGDGCVNVRIEKNSATREAIITSKGYSAGEIPQNEINACVGSKNGVERELELIYLF